MTPYKHVIMFDEKCNCDWCDNPFTRTVSNKFKPRFKACCESCRTQLYRKANEIENAKKNYHTMNVKHLEDLGFTVTIRLRRKK